MIAFVLATLVEGLVQYFVSDPEKKQPWLKFLSAFLGIGVCIAYRVDVLEALGLVSPYAYVGYTISGMVIGRGSNYLNDFITRVRTPVPSVVVEAPSVVKSKSTTVETNKK